MTPNDTDALLSRYLGDNLQSATMRLVGGALLGAAVIALVVWLI